jgi:endonuclease/exonuclease/phosphatase family metal-dependent hydrolase
VALFVRTWNVFHGRTVPDRRKLELERMIRLVTDDRPAVVGLQEVPLWAVGRLGEWSGMRVSAAVAMPALGGPFARRLTALDPRRLRSSLVGQANVLLLGEPLVAAGGQRIVRLNPLSLRRSHRVSRRERIDWLRNRRVAQVVAVDGAGLSFHVVNLHASKGADPARAELGRLEQLLPAGPILLLGDLNVGRTTLPGFSPAIAGIDQILVRGLELERPPATWPAERRRHGDVLLSDHAPVEALVSLGSPAP